MYTTFHKLEDVLNTPEAQIPTLLDSLKVTGLIRATDPIGGIILKLHKEGRLTYSPPITRFNIVILVHGTNEVNIERTTTMIKRLYNARAYNRISLMKIYALHIDFQLEPTTSSSERPILPPTTVRPPSPVRPVSRTVRPASPVRPILLPATVRPASPVRRILPGIEGGSGVVLEPSVRSVLPRAPDRSIVHDPVLIRNYEAGTVIDPVLDVAEAREYFDINSRNIPNYSNPEPLFWREFKQLREDSTVGPDGSVYVLYGNVSYTGQIPREESVTSGSEIIPRRIRQYRYVTLVGGTVKIITNPVTNRADKGLRILISRELKEIAFADFKFKSMSALQRELDNLTIGSIRFEVDSLYVEKLDIHIYGIRNMDGRIIKIPLHLIKQGKIILPSLSAGTYVLS